LVQCNECAEKEACSYYGICMEGRVTQPHHEPPVERDVSLDLDRDRESENSPPPKKRKRRR